MILTIEIGNSTITLGGVGGISLIEFFKNMLSHFRFDAAAGIAYLYCDDISFVPAAYFYPAALGSELKSI